MKLGRAQVGSYERCSSGVLCSSPRWNAAHTSCLLELLRHFQDPIHPGTGSQHREWNRWKVSVVKLCVYKTHRSRVLRSHIVLNDSVIFRLQFKRWNFVLPMVINGKLGSTVTFLSTHLDSVVGGLGLGFLWHSSSQSRSAIFSLHAFLIQSNRSAGRLQKGAVCSFPCRLCENFLLIHFEFQF